MNTGQTLSLILCLAIAAPVSAQEKQKAEKPQRVTSVVVYGDDPCPEGKQGELVVCARKPESERYRVPQELRKKPPKPAERSWKDRTEIVDEATKPSRPNSCSAVGAQGQTGCTAEMLKQWQAERRARKQEEEEASTP